MPKDYIQVSLDLQEFSVLGWKEKMSRVQLKIMGEKTRNLAEQEFDWKQNAHRTVEVYKKAI